MERISEIADAYEYVSKNFQVNLKNITKQSKYNSQAQLAKSLNASTTAVSRWYTGKSLPSADQLYKLSKLFGVSVDWLLTEHQHDTFPSVTYGNAALVLKHLVDMECIKIEDINDYFLYYLVERLQDIGSRPNIDGSKKTSWMLKMLSDYSVTVLRSRPYDYFKSLELEYGDINEDDTHLSVLHAYQKEDERFENIERELKQTWGAKDE